MVILSPVLESESVLAYLFHVIHAIDSIGARLVHEACVNNDKSNDQHMQARPLRHAAGRRWVRLSYDNPI